MVKSTIAAIGLGGAAIIAAYFFLKGPDISKAIDEGIKENKKSLHDNLVNPLFDLFGYETELQDDGDTVRYTPKNPRTALFDETVKDRSGYETKFYAGTVFYPDGRIEGKPPSMTTPQHIRDLVIAARRAQGLGPGPLQGGS